MVGGVNYNKSQFNRATQALRQPGSAFKPFVYLTALQQGWKPEDKVMDAPLSIGSWRPENSDKNTMAKSRSNMHWRNLSIWQPSI